MSSSTRTFYGYICKEDFSKKFPDEVVTFVKGKHYPSWQIASLTRDERNKYFERNHNIGDCHA